MSPPDLQRKYPYYLIPKSAPWSQRAAGMARWARQPNLTAGERARRAQLARQERSKEVQRWQSIISPLVRLYKYQLVTGEKGATKYGKFYRAGMPDYMVFDLGSTPSVRR